MILEEGNLAPNFCLKNSFGREFCLKNFSQKKVVLYFYPKDNTPFCTIESVGFSNLKKDFEKIGIVIFGVSKDSVKSHSNFKDKKNLSVNLLADINLEVQEKYGVLRKKKFMGKEFTGTARTTFFIDKGVVKKVWNNIKVKGHAKEVFDYVNNIK